MSTVDGTDLTQLTATELLDLYRERATSPVEATQAVLERIDALNPTLNAFCLVDADSALASARESEARWQRGEPMGALDGVPTSIKDLILTRGWPTRRGSFTVDPDQPWDVDAPATARLREAGAVFVGDHDARIWLRGDQLADDRHHPEPVGSEQDERWVLRRDSGCGRRGARAVEHWQ